MLTEQLNLKNQRTEEQLEINSKDSIFLKKICSFQDNLNASEYRRDRRLHGLQLPLHPLQLIGWIALLCFGLAAFLLIIPAFHPKLQQPIFCVLSGLYVIHFISHLSALLLDPADCELRKQKKKQIIPEFDRTKHFHVIENGRCHLCNIKITCTRTKHCSVCNKCVNKFDHHCKWLNHCVGGRNYVAFLMCVVSAVIAALVILTAAIAEIVFYHFDPEWLNSLYWDNPTNNSNSEIFFNASNITNTTINETNFSNDTTTSGTTENNTTTNNGIGLSNTIFLIFISIIGILAAITAGLLLHLCFFHIYISFLGLTTYEYIRNHRQNVLSTAQPPSQQQRTTQNHQTQQPVQTSCNQSNENDSTNPSNRKQNNNKLYFCSKINTNLSNNSRPKTLHCCDKSHEYHHHKTSETFYMCSLLKESSKNSNSHTFHCCSEYHHKTINNDDTNNIETTRATTSESFVQYEEKCTYCSFRIKSLPSDIISIQDKRCCVKTVTKHHRWRRKWNCCSNVPDSPDIPDAVITVPGIVNNANNENRENINTISSTISQVQPSSIEFQHQQQPESQQNGANNHSNNILIMNTDNMPNTNDLDYHNNHQHHHHHQIEHSDDSPNRNDNANNSQRLKNDQASFNRRFKRFRRRLIIPYTPVRFRLMVRMIRMYGKPMCPEIQEIYRNNQVRPMRGNERSSVNHILPTSIIRNENNNRGNITLPALPPPSRRKILKNNTADLQELVESLSFVQQQNQQQQSQTIRLTASKTSSLRRPRRKNVLKSRSSTLSPIHESGLSNPTSPLPCRHASCLTGNSGNGQTISSSNICSGSIINSP